MTFVWYWAQTKIENFGRLFEGRKQRNGLLGCLIVEFSLLATVTILNFRKINGVPFKFSVHCFYFIQFN